MDIVERLIAYRDRPGRSRHGRELLAEACNEIGFLRREIERLTLRLNIEEMKKAAGFPPPPVASTDTD
jgi:hypothetical protein